jgi:hypothetical protein
MSNFCNYCDKELSEEKGELAHGCLNCHYDPRVEKIKQLEQRLKEAEEVVAFYADVKSWDNANELDFEICIVKDYVCEDNTGGLRAREYQAKHQKHF